MSISRGTGPRPGSEHARASASAGARARSGRTVGWNALLFSSEPGFRSAGIHGYIASLLPELAAREDVEVVAVTADPGARAALPETVEIVRAPALARRRAGRVLYEQLRLAGDLRRAGARLYHGAAYAMPRFGLRGMPALVTVHDLSFFRLPDAFPPRQARYLRLATRMAARRADGLVAVSEFTRDELVSVLGVEPPRITVVPNGYDPAFRPMPPDEIAAWRRGAGLPERFVLCVGTLQPRKNVGTLVQAFAELRGAWAEGDGEAPDLVVAGGAGWGRDDVGTLAERLGIGRHVHRTGYVPADDLPRYYAAADVFAFPSRYEGFGLPALEAMATGTPVVAARAASLPEVVGDAGLLVAPDDVAGWAAALGALLTSPARRGELAEAGIARAERFSWTRAAEQTAELYAAVLGASGEDARRPAQAGEGRRADRVRA